ncbi:hypothetical protein [Methylobacterium sp. WL103]|uniref:hypothetical protein n=1 Tax=Methylobacterium sp. WL103 TaxID=2603891 RepID=UPI0011CBD7CB|nr:hypothetical protein [Methylobacterium sp. WL103]
MAELKAVALVKLQEIADNLGVSVDQFTTGKIAIDLMAADECLRLWSLLKTDRGRQQALDALRQVVETEAA